MARHEKDFDTSAAAPLSAPQLRALIDPATRGHPGRANAVARFLAGADGWEQAAKSLGGAFADCKPGLKDDQSE